MFETIAGYRTWSQKDLTPSFFDLAQIYEPHPAYPVSVRHIAAFVEIEPAIVASDYPHLHQRYHKRRNPYFGSGIYLAIVSCPEEVGTHKELWGFRFRHMLRRCRSIGVSQLGREHSGHRKMRLGDKSPQSSHDLEAQLELQLDGQRSCLGPVSATRQIDNFSFGLTGRYTFGFAPTPA